jgi:uncharacterized protein (DUF433 family)
MTGGEKNDRADNSPGCILTDRMSAAPRPSRSKPRIVETPGVCGGYPRIWNTRISVGLVVEAYHNTDCCLDRTAAAFPQLTAEQVQAALDYYTAHTERVNEDIASNAEALDQLPGR